MKIMFHRPMLRQRIKKVKKFVKKTVAVFYKYSEPLSKEGVRSQLLSKKLFVRIYLEH